MNDGSDNFEDLLNSGEMNDWLFRAKRDMFPKMKASVFSLVIGGDNADAKLCLEVGAATNNIAFHLPERKRGAKE